jgi:GrpB-like predicted nucleotidyltransferase (UPF0157 family)
MVALLFILLAACPFFLLPTLFAYKNEKANAAGFLIGNLVLLGLLASGVGGLMIDDADSMRVSMPVPRVGVTGGLIIWLVLLHFSLRRDGPRESDIDERVTLAPYDAAWPAAFENERQRLCEILAVPPEVLEHIGSTAVPGMLTKPVVDMMLGLPRYPPPDEFVNRLTILGYQDMREANLPGRRYLRLREGRPFNLHIVERGGEHWINNLRLRDHLRADASARERYAAAKQQALEKGDRLLAYSAAKQGVLSELLAATRPAAA